MRLVLVKFSVSSTWWNDERFPYVKLQSLLHGALSGRRMRQIVRAGKEETSRNSRKNTKTTTEGEELWETELRDEKIEWSWEKYKEMGLQNAGAREKMVVETPTTEKEVFGMTIRRGLNELPLRFGTESQTNWGLRRRYARYQTPETTYLFRQAPSARLLHGRDTQHAWRNKKCI